MNESDKKSQLLSHGLPVSVCIFYDFRVGWPYWCCDVRLPNYDEIPKATLQNELEKHQQSSCSAKWLICRSTAITLPVCWHKHDGQTELLMPLSTSRLVAVPASARVDSRIYRHNNWEPITTQILSSSAGRNVHLSSWPEKTSTVASSVGDIRLIT